MDFDIFTGPIYNNIIYNIINIYILFAYETVHFTDRETVYKDKNVCLETDNEFIQVLV